MNGQGHDDPLSAEKLQVFIAGLSGLPMDEVRKAKSLYIRNAISTYKAFESSCRAFGYVQILLALIPIFWPILLLQRHGLNAQRRLFRERIENALAVWKDDLRGETFELGGQTLEF